MALRLVDSTKSSAAAAGNTGRSIVERARIALRRRELDQLPALAAECAAIDDAHRRYVARRSLIEAGMEGAAATSGPAAARTLAATARAGLTVLADAPAEPVLLNLTGVALYELGSLRGAEALFRAARALDRALPHVDANLDQVARRRRGGVRVDVPPDVALALPELARRAAATARSARPAVAATISLCMIVRDEEEVLARCLEAARPAVDEIIVVDTGSTDASREIAREHGATVLEHEWNDSFADARNVGLDAATGDWILFLDADEILVAEDAPRLRELVRRTWREAFFLTVSNYVGSEGDGTAVAHDSQRLFRNRPAHRFEGRIHEGIAHALPADAPERVELAGVRIEHFGYLKQTREAKDKSRRNLALLERQAREGRATAFLSYNLGTEHAALGDLTRAVEHFEQGLELLHAEGDPSVPAFAPSLVARHVQALRAVGRAAEADAAAERGLALFPGLTDLVFEQALIARDRGDRDAAEALLDRALEMGDAPSRYAAVVGAGTFLAATALAAVRRSRGDRASAEALLLDALADHPRYLGAVLPLGEVMLARGASPEALVAAVAERVGALTPSTRFVLATALYEAGHAGAAEEQLRALLADDPTAAPAQLALAEALLSQRRWDEAAEIAAAVPAGTAPAPRAAVTEAFARIVAGDADGTARALARAEAVGTPPVERDALAAWSAAAGAAGAAGPARLPLAATPLLLTVLEALLRVEEVDAFAALVPVLERVDGLSRRARRGALAGVYERRGFLASAAEEWIAAVDEDGADAPALLGLARLAAAGGSLDDARLFALEARALPGGSAESDDLLAALAGG